MPLPHDALARLNRAEAQAHGRYGTWADFGPLRAVYAGLGLPINAAWHDGGRPPTAADLSGFEAFCAGHGERPTLHLLSPALSAALPALQARGYALTGLLHAYLHDLHHLPPFPDGVQETADPTAWAALSAKGFGEGSDRVMEVVAQAPGTRLFTADRSGQPAGGGALSVTGEVAALYGMSTRPTARTQGVQTDLLAARLHAATQAGATLASVFVTPGSPSERNVQRAGFALAGARLTFTQLGA